MKTEFEIFLKTIKNSRTCDEKEKTSVLFHVDFKVVISAKSHTHRTIRH
jgi:hypothetical protein